MLPLSPPMKTVLIILASFTILFQSACSPFFRSFTASQMTAMPPEPCPFVGDPNPAEPNQPPTANHVDNRPSAEEVIKHSNDLLKAKKFDAIEKIASEA